MIKSLRLSGAEAGPAVAVHGLTKIFPVPFHPTRGLVAVKDLNLRIKARSSLRIAGTEWLRQEHHVILGLVSPTRGRTEIFGRESRGAVFWPTNFRTARGANAKHTSACKVSTMKGEGAVAHFA